MSKWPHFNKVKFLDDFITAKRSVSNYKVYTYKRILITCVYTRQ